MALHLSPQRAPLSPTKSGRTPKRTHAINTALIEANYDMESASVARALDCIR